MDSVPNFSVGIPTYNHGKYVGAAIESLLDQTVAPLELVVCNNHSTDDTAEVLARFGDRIRVISPPEHLSMMANWNHLVGQLRGEWVALLSSDDLALPPFVEALWEGTQLAEDAVLVRADVDFVDGEGQDLGTRRRRVPGVTSPPKNFLERLYGPKVNFNAVAFRKDAWEKSGGFPESCRLAGDWAFWLELTPFGSFTTVSVPVSRYRKGHRSREEEHARLVLWAEDYRAIYRELMPRIAKELGVSPALVRHAMRSRCTNFLSRLSRSLPNESREEVARELADWAKDCDVERALERFRAGERFGKRRFRRLRRWAATLGLSNG